MSIAVRLDVVLAQRKMRSRELAQRVGVTEQNISRLKSRPCKTSATRMHTGFAG
ncbi:MAG: hypothetical protein Fur0014_22440 [Rubrivivax sp.]